MFVRILTLRFDDALGGFDDTPVQELLKDKEVVSIREHFFVKNTIPHLTLVVTYTLADAAAPAPAATKSPRARWHDLLDAADRPLFNTLRDWRRERSKHDGVPPYVICTDRTLASVAQRRPQSLAKLGEVPGVGPAKVKKYGAELLGLVQHPPAAPALPPAETAAAATVEPPSDRNDDAPDDA